MIQLRDYQKDVIDKIRHNWFEGKRSLMIQAPPGAGKTVIFSYIAQQAILKFKKVLIVTHRMELLTETGGTLSEFGINSSLIKAGVKNPDNNGSCFVAMTTTLKNRMKKPEWREWLNNNIDLLIIDEGHEQHSDWIHDYYFKHCLCFSATPKRKGKQKQLGEMYDSIVKSLDVQELINLGYLVKDRYFGVDVDMKGVGRDSKGEYKTSEMFEKFDKPELYHGVIDNWKRICNDTITIVFCVNIRHCIETCRAFNDAGIKSKFLVSNPQEKDIEIYNQNISFTGKRENILNEWKNGDFKILINAGILTTGFNYKPIQTVIIYRATTSENLWIQMIGRGSRISEVKKYFYLLDFGLNANRLGHYLMPRDYQLFHDVSKRSDNVPPSKLCPSCEAMLFASAVKCKYCGYIFEKLAKEKEFIELIEKLPFKESIKKVQSISDLESFQKTKGYNKNWLFRQIFIKHGAAGLKKYAKQKGFHWSWAKRIERIYSK